MTDLKTLRELAERATTGPWGISLQGETDNYVIKTNDHGDITHYICEGVMDNDLPYIAAASPDVVLALIERVEQLDTELRNVYKAHKIVMNKNAELEAVYQQLKAKYMNEWDRVASQAATIADLKSALEEAKKAFNKIQSENKPVSGTGGIESKEYWMAQEIKSRMIAFHALTEIEALTKLDAKGGV